MSKNITLELFYSPKPFFAGFKISYFIGLIFLSFSLNSHAQQWRLFSKTDPINDKTKVNLRSSVKSEKTISKIALQCEKPDHHMYFVIDIFDLSRSNSPLKITAPTFDQAGDMAQKLTIQMMQAFAMSQGQSPEWADYMRMVTTRLGAREPANTLAISTEINSVYIPIYRIAQIKKRDGESDELMRMRALLELLKEEKLFIKGLYEDDVLTISVASLKSAIPSFLKACGLPGLSEIDRLVAAQVTKNQKSESQRLTPIKILSNRPFPAYPIESVRAKESGKVLVKVLVDPAGRIAQIEINKSSGYTKLDDAAMKAVSLWKFSPARIGEATIAESTIVSISFGDQDEEVPENAEQQPRKAEFDAQSATEQSPRDIIFQESAVDDPSTNLNWLIHISNYTELQGAAKEQDRLRSLGYESIISPSNTHIGMRYRVRVGPYPSKESALIAIEYLSEKGFWKPTIVEDPD